MLGFSRDGGLRAGEAISCQHCSLSPTVARAPEGSRQPTRGSFCLLRWENQVTINWLPSNDSSHSSGNQESKVQVWAGLPLPGTEGGSESRLLPAFWWLWAILHSAWLVAAALQPLLCLCTASPCVSVCLPSPLSEKSTSHCGFRVYLS